MPILPTQQQLEELAESDEHGPVVMLNLLRFAAEGGRDSYASYGEGMRTVLQAAGAEVLWSGRGDSVVIGDPDDDRWDAVLLVRYPSRRAFLDMVSSSAYEKVGERRTSALVDSRLVACTELWRSNG